MASGPINLALSSLLIGSGLTYANGTLSVTAGQSTVTSVTAPAGETLTLSADDGNGGKITLGIDDTIVLTGTLGSTQIKTSVQADSYALTTSDYVVLFSGTATGRTFTLIAASANTGRVFIIKNRGTQTITIDATGLGQLWTTSATNTMSLIVGEAVTLVSDGTFWIVISMASGIIVP